MNFVIQNEYVERPISIPTSNLFIYHPFSTCIALGQVLNLIQWVLIHVHLWKTYLPTMIMEMIKKSFLSILIHKCRNAEWILCPHLFQLIFLFKFSSEFFTLSSYCLLVQPLQFFLIFTSVSVHFYHQYLPSLFCLSS